MDPAELLSKGLFAECLEKCETELRFATSAQTKFALNVIGSQAAGKLNELDKAVAMAELAIKLDDTKMNAWQAVADAWRAKNDPRLGEALTKQMQIARKNGKLDRALSFAKEAARAFDAAGRLPESALRWREAESCLTTNDSSSNDERIEIYENLAEVLARMDQIAESEKVLWGLLELRKDEPTAIRLISRPVHVLLESRRTQQGQAADIESAWSEVARRLDIVEGLIGPDTHLSFATRMIITESTGNMCVDRIVSQEDVARAQRVLNDPSAHDAFRTRAWFVMGRKALSDGDPIAALAASRVAEQLEQVVYAKLSSSQTQSSSSERTVVMIGAISSTPMRPFNGMELYSLVCGRTAIGHLTAARATLAGMRETVPDVVKLVKKQSRDGLSWLSKGLVENTELGAALREVVVHAEWLLDVCNCTRGPVSPSSPSSSTGTMDSSLEDLVSRLRTTEDVSRLVDSFAALRIDPKVTWFHQRIAYLGEMVSSVLAYERDGSISPPTIAADWQPSCQTSSIVRALVSSAIAPTLMDEETRVSTARSLDLINVWKQRLEYVKLSRRVPGTQFNPADLVAIVDARDPNSFPLACEILGKAYMGYDASQSFTAIPDEQPPPKQVRDPVAGVKYLQKAVTLDPLGIGAAGPLANAFHAVGKKEMEAKAALMYQGMLDQLSSPQNGDPHPSNGFIASWTWTRLAQQQLHHGKYPNAAASYQRALTSLTRAEMSRDVTAWSGLGEAHMRMGRLGAAAQAFEKAVAILDEDRLLLPPESSSSSSQVNLLCACLIKLASVRTKLGQSSRASEPLKRVLEENPLCDRALLDVAEIDLAESLLEQGRFLSARGALTAAMERFAESRERFQSYLRRVPMSAQGLKGLGDVLSELGHAEEAKTAYLQTCFVEPWEALARFDLGRLLVATGKDADKEAVAIRACEAAVVLDPLDASSWNLLGVARRRSNDLLVKQHCFVRSLQLDPNASSGSWLNLAWTLLQADRVGLAKRGFSQAQTIEADSAAAWIGHAMLAIKENKSEIPALECAVDAAQYGAESCALDAMILLGKSICDESASDFAFQKETKREELARKLLDVSARAVQLARGDVSKEAMGWSMTGIALVALGQKDQAIPAFERAAELFLEGGMVENADRVLCNLGSLCDPEVGLSLCKMAAQRTTLLNDLFEYHSTVGDLLVQSGDFDSGSESFQRALELCSQVIAKSSTPSEYVRLMRNHLRVQTCRALLGSSRSEQSEALMLRLAEEVCEDCKQLLPGSMVILNDLARIGPAFKVMARDNAMPYPSLSFRPADGDESLTRALADISLDSPVAVAMMRPWSAEAWMPSSSSLMNVHAAEAVLKLCEREPPRTTEPILKAGLVYLQQRQSGSTQRESGCYWTRGSCDLKLRFLCPWEAIDVK